MLLLYIGIVIICVVAVVQIVRTRQRYSSDYASLANAVHETKDKYSFLIDKDFNVKETNFYELNENIRDDQPYVLGNVIHCQVGCDAGLCGTGIACNDCPLRMVLKNGFKMKRNFNDIAAKMHLYDANHDIQEVNVKVDGQFTYIGDKPHFIVMITR